MKSDTKKFKKLLAEYLEKKPHLKEYQQRINERLKRVGL